LDWDAIRNKDAPLVPHIEHPTDTSNFPVEDDDEEETTSESDEEEERMESKYPLYRGRRLRQTDIPFIGMSSVNLVVGISVG